MQELIIGLLGVLGLLIGVKLFDKYNIGSNQKKLDSKVAADAKKQANLEGQQTQEDKETKRKVDEINKEQTKPLSHDELSDWFSKRK